MRVPGTRIVPAFQSTCGRARNKANGRPDSNEIDILLRRYIGTAKYEAYLSRKQFAVGLKLMAIIAKSSAFLLILILQLAWLDDVAALDNGGTTEYGYVLENNDYLPACRSQVPGSRRNSDRPLLASNDSAACRSGKYLLDELTSMKACASATHCSLEGFMCLLC